MSLLPDPPGTLYGTLLNRASNLAALRAGLGEGGLAASVYKAEPRAPVLYLKPANCFAADGAVIDLDADVAELELGATVALVLARPAAKVDEGEALARVAGYRLMMDLSQPHASLHRPAIRQRCRDGFAPLGTALLPALPTALRVFVNEELRQVVEFDDDLLRPPARLLADVSAFMTLQAGDLLHLGVAEGAPRVRAGDRLRIEGGGASLSVRLAGRLA
ncbi:hypothetical protein G8A07_25160 [Roseateles sp. DAIF2]|uniref:fumarylacetoacetate hydrolase family protein n=1 Tax=Roseateles sp. DAIF2 TaxID=2714952 RepID=UPI0018A2D57E|nr:fumarylacetoacetate hydrolase family protein [Roseateles sp. DAIF2]QPF75878.1 hypothetical protein G8A07_25160 [Roseateles sp. DAIF2]